MAIVCPVDLDTSRLRHEMQAIYAGVATDPSSEFHCRRETRVRRERARRSPLAGDGLLRGCGKPASDRHTAGRCDRRRHRVRRGHGPDARRERGRVGRRSNRR